MTNAVYVSEIGAISDENARQIAKTLPYLGSGVSRSVYDLGDCVLKVDSGNTWAGNCQSEVECWEEYAGTEHEHLFARVLASGRGWLIAEKVIGDLHSYETCEYSSQDAQDAIHQLEWLGIGDLHPGNLGQRPDGSVCAIDYAMNDYRDHVSAVVSPCDCGDHDCRDCYPDGCECCCDLHNWEGCETFQGCRKEECDECYATAVYHWQTRFGFELGVIGVGPNGVGMVRHWEHYHACRNHVPAHIRNTAKPQLRGQLQLAYDTTNAMNNLARALGH